MKFSLLLFKHCYDYNSKNYKKIHPQFNFNVKVENKYSIEKEFGEMVDHLSLQYELDEENDYLIKLILFYYYQINENKFHQFLENDNIINKIISIIIQNNYFFKSPSRKLESCETLANAKKSFLGVSSFVTSSAEKLSFPAFAY